MAYTPKQWVCGETITVDALNHMERALEELADGYVPTQWQAGDVITADKLNKIEQAIADAYTEGCKDESNLIGRTLSGLYVNSTVSVIGSCAFRGATDLETASFPNVTNIGMEAFELCYNLSEIYVPNLLSTDEYAFASCGLKSFDAPLLSEIRNNAFRKCSQLESVNFSTAQSIGLYAFQDCTLLSDVSIPNVAFISSGAFSGCVALSIIDLPNVQVIGSSAFVGCTSLATVSCPNVQSIRSSAFYGCSNLMSVYILGSSVPSLYSKAFMSTPMETYQYTGSFGSIFVPASLVTTYQSAPMWSAYHNRITAYTE